MTAVTIAGVRRAFGHVQALDGVDLEVREQEIFGLVGPNGSGKTTLLNCLQGLDRPDAGEVSVLGLDPQRDRAELTLRMGVQLQSAHTIPRLKVREALTLFASLYPNSRPVDEVLAELGLSSKADARIDKLSGGQAQRVFIALALLQDPELLFFDELTSAVDPQARRAIWDILKGLRERGHTVVLTTHSMEEAAELCDRVAVIDAGRIIALGTPAELIARYGGPKRLELTVEGAVSKEALVGLDGVDGVTVDGSRVTIAGQGNFAPEALSVLATSGVVVRDMLLTDPTLDDVFLALTGRAMREDA